MKKINNALIFVIILASVCFFVRDLNIGAYDRLPAIISIPFVLFIPRIVKQIFKIKISDSIETVYVVFIFLAHFLGSVVALYDTIWWYDLFAHFLSGVLTSILALLVMNMLNSYDGKNKIFNALFIISFVLMVASVWEFLEFGSDTFFKSNVQHAIETGVKDTIEDMLVAFLGGVLVSISYLLNEKLFKKMITFMKVKK